MAHVVRCSFILWSIWLAQAVDINVTVVPSSEPFIFSDTATAIPGVANSQYTGMAVDLVQYVISHINANLPLGAPSISVTMHNPTIGTYGTKINGTYDGLIGDLLANRSALSPMDVTITSARVDDGVMFSTPFLSSGLYVLTQRVPATPSVWRFLQPFTTELWLTLLVAMFALSITLYLLDKWSPFGFRRTSMDEHEQRELSLPNSTFTSIMLLLKKEGSHARAMSTRIAFAAGVMMIMLLFNAYRAGLNVIVAIKELVPNIQGIQDLQQQGLKFAVAGGTAQYDFFTQNTDASIRAMVPNLVAVPDAATGIALLRRGTVSAYIDARQSLEYSIRFPPCDLAIVGQPLNTFYWAWAVNPTQWPAYMHGYVRSNLTRALSSAIEDGTVNRLYAQYFQSADSCVNSATTTVYGEGVVEEDVAGVVYIFLLFVLLGMGMLAFEFFAYRKKNSKHVFWRNMNTNLGLSVQHNHSRDSGGVDTRVLQAALAKKDLEILHLQHSMRNMSLSLSSIPEDSATNVESQHQHEPDARSLRVGNVMASIVAVEDADA